MAINEDTSLPNRHIFLSAKTGYGKSQAMRNEVVPASGARVIFWDPDRDHNAKHYTDWKSFLGALKAATATGGAFRIAWAGEDSPERFSGWCEACWRVLDGRYDTWMVCEELADLEMGQKTLPGLGKLQKRARKYGGILVTNTQRVQEIPKSLITQAAEKWIGRQEDHDARYMARLTGADPKALERVEPLEFLVKSDGEWVRKKVKYKAHGTNRRGKK